ncbi:MAG: NAD(P)H-dependent oxidoreductase [Omnitrophica bacterium]|nr:NAD(P)H-dependent oxidoreductase [Candidatus Omnitrophota bacterium]
MRTAIVYYSYTRTGNTHRIARLAAETLRREGEKVVPVRIRPLKEAANFFAQCAEAFFAKKPELYRTLLDFKDFDRIIIGSPVWAFKPAPAINTFLAECGALDGKEAICFVTHAGGAGRKNALEILKKKLAIKGACIAQTAFFRGDETSEECRVKLSKLLTNPS